MPEIPTRILNEGQVTGMIKMEYLALSAGELTVSKRFVLSDGRQSNAFLINSDNPERSSFIAKGYVRHPDSLLREWYFLRLLQDANAHAPRLLFPEHEPRDLMLMEYFDGPTVPDALLAGQNPDDIFRKIGETVGKIHTISVPFVGDPHSHKDETWQEHQQERLNSRRAHISGLLGEGLTSTLDNMIGQTEYILEEESQKEMKLVHRDLYLDNFLIDPETGDAVLIDYGISIGGRPLFDLAKFYIWALAKYPNQKATFFDGYTKHAQLPENFEDVMRLYIIRELFGMIDYFEKVGFQKGKEESLETLRQFVQYKGIVCNLLEASQND